MTDRPVRHDIWTLLDTMQMDLRDLSAKMVELRAQISNVELPETPKRSECPECGLTLKGPRTLLEHRYVAHNSVPDPDMDDGA